MVKFTSVVLPVFTMLLNKLWLYRNCAKFSQGLGYNINDYFDINQHTI